MACIFVRWSERERDTARPVKQRTEIDSTKLVRICSWEIAAPRATRTVPVVAYYCYGQMEKDRRD